MESLAYIYLALGITVILECLGLAMRFVFLRRSKWLATPWKAFSLGLTLCALGISSMSIYFTGTDALGAFLLGTAVIICVGGTVISFLSD